jgi:hypothetical protein
MRDGGNSVHLRLSSALSKGSVVMTEGVGSQYAKSPPHAFSRLSSAIHKSDVTELVAAEQKLAL